MSEVLQYELWRECNCKCTFCTLGEDNCFTDTALKLNSLCVAIDELKRLKPLEHKVVGFIGGEFFQGQLNNEKVRNKFFELIDVTNELLSKGYINNIWLNASLLIGNQKDLYNTIDKITDKDKLWILTSYDTLGRFHTKKMFDTWEYHVFNLKDKYPNINLNTTSILTGDFILKYLNNEFNISNFRNKYNTSFFLKNPVKPTGFITESPKTINEKLGYFFPKRADFLKFLQKYLENEGVMEYDKLISTELRADEVRKNYNTADKRNIKFIRDRNTLHEAEGDGTLNEDLDCGHNDIYASYLDSNKCMLCDKQLIKNLNK